MRINLRRIDRNPPFLYSIEFNIMLICLKGNSQFYREVNITGKSGKVGKYNLYKVILLIKSINYN